MKVELFHIENHWRKSNSKCTDRCIQIRHYLYTFRGWPGRGVVLRL